MSLLHSKHGEQVTYKVAPSEELFDLANFEIALLSA